MHHLVRMLIEALLSNLNVILLESQKTTATMQAYMKLLSYAQV